MTSGTFSERAAQEWPSLTIDVQRAITKALAEEITIGKDQKIRIVWKDARELAVDYVLGALPTLRAPALKAMVRQ